MAQRRRPLVGISGRRSRSRLLSGRDARFSATEFDSFTAEFAGRVAACGAAPVHLPFEAAATEVVAQLDALIVTGGQDVHPRNWGGHQYIEADRESDPRTSFHAYDPERDEYEAALIRTALAAGAPLLAVCRGMQLLNVVRGGTLVADLRTGSVAHDSRAAACTDGAADHVVELAPGSLAHLLYGPALVTNSWHHQAVAEPGDSVVVTGRTPDGSVEAIEMPEHDVLGVQWHPEWRVTPDPAFRWLVDAALRRVDPRPVPLNPVPCSLANAARVVAARCPR